jgi:hypothetical protein
LGAFLLRKNRAIRSNLAASGQIPLLSLARRKNALHGVFAYGVSRTQNAFHFNHCFLMATLIKSEFNHGRHGNHAEKAPNSVSFPRFSVVCCTRHTLISSSLG